jgi:hypothetical protein
VLEAVMNNDSIVGVLELLRDGVTMLLTCNARQSYARLILKYATTYMD